MEKKLVWLLVGVLGTLAAGEYDVDCGKNSNRIFFAKSAAEKEQPIQRVKFITALLNPADERWADKKGLYTARSRAVHQLIILRK